jgi:hypothetical protein
VKALGLIALCALGCAGSAGGADAADGAVCSSSADCNGWECKDGLCVAVPDTAPTAPCTGTCPAPIK